jgi:hypothetical protein
MISVSVGSPAGTCSVGTPAFYRFVLRLAEADITLSARDKTALDVLAAIPHAYADDDAVSGDGWRVVPPVSYEDWAVLEATPQRLRTAFQTARRVLWTNAAPVGISAGDIQDIDRQIDDVLGVIHRAEASGYSVNASYVA